MRFKFETKIDIKEWDSMPEDLKIIVKRKAIHSMINSMPIDFLDQLFNITILDPNAIGEAIMEAEEKGLTPKQIYYLKMELFELKNLGMVKIKAAI